MAEKQNTKRTFLVLLNRAIWILLGCILAAISLELFLLPNDIIDGGIVGVSMICGSIFGQQFIPLFLLLFNLPFLILAYRSLGKQFAIQMISANLMFAGCLSVIHHWVDWHFVGDPIEVIVVGGLMLGIGIGLIIRVGGCLDGTEILAILLNKSKGFTVGQVVLFVNIFIFTAAGLVFGDWHPPIFSFITFVVAIQLIDKVIVGMEETKSVKIISTHSAEISQVIVHEMGLGLTVMYGRGGYSGEDVEVLMVITERLQLSELKEHVYSIDPRAFVAVESLHEIYNGRQDADVVKKGDDGKGRKRRPFIPKVQH